MSTWFQTWPLCHRERDKALCPRCRLDWFCILIGLAPTHPPPPLSRPAGRKRGASCGRVLKGGKYALDRALASKCLQPIKKLSGRLEANVPWRVYFPPSKTGPNVAVSPPFRPGGGGEGLGERGGIQREKNRNAVNSQLGGSSTVSHHAQAKLQKTEHNRHITRGLGAESIKKNVDSPRPSSACARVSVSP